MPHRFRHGMSSEGFAWETALTFCTIACMMESSKPSVALRVAAGSFWKASVKMVTVPGSDVGKEAIN